MVNEIEYCDRSHKCVPSLKNNIILAAGLDVYVNEDIYKTIKKAKKKLLKVALKYEGPVEAPIKKDDIIGKFRVVYDDELVGEYNLLAATNIEKVNIFTRLIKSLNYLIWGDV